MKKVVFNILLLAVLMVGFGVSQAWAQSTKPLKGNWLFTITVPGQGAFPAPFSFKSKGKGTFTVPQGGFALCYRESGASFSVSVEVPKEISPVNAPLTIIFRGTKSSDSAATGNVFIITESSDSSNPLGVGLLKGTFTGARQ